MKFYESTENFPEAVELAKQQRNDGWSKTDVTEYWYALGYDIFFVHKLMKELELKQEKEQ